jgi:hypothetical protein
MDAEVGWPSALASVAGQVPADCRGPLRREPHTTDGQPVPDVGPNAAGVVRMRAALDVHERTIVCASRPDDARARAVRVEEIPNTERTVPS